MAVIDADSHIYERPNMWLDHIEPSRRHLALSIETDQLGHSWMVWGGQRLFGTGLTSPGDYAGMGEPLERARLGLPAVQSYADDMPEDYWNASARADLNERWGVDASVCFPHWGINWELSLEDDLEASRANMEAWNRWAVELRADGRGRVHPVGHVSLRGDLDWLDDQLAALAAGGVRLALSARGLIDGRRPSHPDFDRAWSSFVEHGITPVFHVGTCASRMVAPGWTDNDPYPIMPIFTNLLIGQDMKLYMADLVLNGVFDRHPRLHVRCMELSSRWFVELLNGIDGNAMTQKLMSGRQLRTLEHLPSEYLRDRVRISPFLMDDPRRLIDEHGDLFMFSSDYPHAEGMTSPVETVREAVGAMSSDQEQAFFGGNIEWLLDGPQG
jgi:predicted TIM-barrel fold metal-dependent hydrolase